MQTEPHSTKQPKQHVEGAWQRFEKAAMPIDCPQIQKDEMKKAFFAGAVSLYNLLLVGISPGPKEMKSDFVLMKEILDEFNAYAVKLIKGF